MVFIAKNQQINFKAYHVKYTIGDDPTFKKEYYSDESWKNYKIGEALKNHKKPFIYWIRFKFNNDKPSLKQPAISLGKIGDIDEVYFNGELIGFNGSIEGKSKSYYHYPRLYRIPKHLLKNNNIVAIRAKKSGILSAGIHSGPVDFGEYEDLRISTGIVNFLSLGLGMILCFFSLMVGLYHLYLYFRIKEYRYNLVYFFFSLFSAVFIYSAAWGFNNHITNPKLIPQIHALSGVLTTIFYLVFVVRFLNLKINYWHKLIIQLQLIIAGACFFYNDVDHIVRIYRVWFFLALFTILYAGYLFIVHYYNNNRKDLRVLIYSIVIMFLCAGFDSLYGFVVFSSFQLSGIGIFALNVGIIFSVAQKFTTNYLEVQREVEGHTQIMYERAQQVAHDIRSPLTALNVVSKDLSGLPEGSRVLLRASIQRIQDIANNLVSKSEVYTEDTEGIDEHNTLESVLLLPVIEEIVSEKRHQQRSKEGVNIVLDSEQTYGLFAKVDEHTLKRVLSNLINNSVEAFEGSGEVVVQITECLDSDEVLILVKDNGRGIPKDVLPKLGERGASFGKEAHKGSGSGLGLYHAKSSIEQWGGRFIIDSEEGNGTEIQLYLPKTDAPDWFIPAINLEGIKTIIMLDDDESIHQVWEKRLSPYTEQYNIELKHARCPDAFEKLVQEREGLLCLCDYELLGYKETGLDLIEQNKLEDMAILVTSRYAEEAVQGRCKKLGIKLIPKTSADLVPFTLKDKEST
ncbi:sensor histidine kinase [bacterium]|nr:sensor histidine kinase [bacterium]